MNSQASAISAAPTDVPAIEVGRVESAVAKLSTLLGEVGRHVIGQEELVRTAVIGLLTRGIEWSRPAGLRRKE